MEAKLNNTLNSYEENIELDSQIAEIIIRNQTAGMITVSRARSITPHCDGDVISLCQKLLDCQEASIRQMQQFL